MTERGPGRLVQSIMLHYGAIGDDGSVIRHDGKVVFHTSKAAHAARVELHILCARIRYVYRCRSDPSHCHLTKIKQPIEETALRWSYGEWSNTLSAHLRGRTDQW